MKTIITTALILTTFLSFGQIITPEIDSVKTDSTHIVIDTVSNQQRTPDTITISSKNFEGFVGVMKLIDQGDYVSFTYIPELKKKYDSSPEGILKGLNYKRVGRSFGLGVVRGFIKGTHEVLVNHYADFQRRFPNANPQFWNPAISWTNKYKNGDEKQGDAYFLSTNIGVVVSDAYHLTSALETASVVGITVTISLNGKGQPWYNYTIEAGAALLGSGIGFEMADILLRKKQ